MKTRLALGLSALVFAVLATANSGGYRYGVSDQAFYQPAVVKALNPALYPRDTSLIEAQAGLALSDEIQATLARLLGVDLPPLFFAIYVVTLAGLFFAAVSFARSAGLSWPAVAACILLLTFRHRIAKTGANSLEGYAHPRELAFAVGVAALACLVRGRDVWAVVWTAIAALLHPTTALWFGIVVVVAIGAARPNWRRDFAVLLVAGAAVAVWAATNGPLAGRLVRMDTTWLSVLGEKDYLFPTAWPLYAWVANLGYVGVIGLIYRRRASLGLVGPGERGLGVGLLALVAIFLVSVPLTSLRLALAVQLQVTRVFWLLDFVAVVYISWWLMTRAITSSRLRWVVLSALAVVSVGRGVFLLRSAEPSRQLVQVSLAETPWSDALGWLKHQPASWHVLADPGQAWKYGVSVRVGAERDTLLESSKDAAIAIYDRDVALRVADRSHALADFDRLTTAGARALARRYGLDVLVVEKDRPFDLPRLYENAGFVVYDLR